MLIPFAPGGATDIIARMVEPKMSRALGQQIVVDNRPGAAGNIAVELTAQAQPDGYTLLVGNISTNSINPILFAGRMKVNAIKDLTGVTKLVAIPNFLLGSPKVPGTTLREAIEYAKSRPGQLNFGAPLGSYSHLDMLAFTAQAGIRMVHIPTKGAGETLANLLRGDSHIQISNVASNIGPVRAGQIKAYAVTSEKRLVDFPAIPTMADAGFPGIGSLNWNGIFAAGAHPETRGGEVARRRGRRDERAAGGRRAGEAPDADQRERFSRRVQCLRAVRDAALGQHHQGQQGQDRLSRVKRLGSRIEDRGSRGGVAEAAMPL